jgi:hypothetical protein
MAELGNLLNSLFKASGIDTNSDEVKAILSNGSIANYPIPDKVETSIMNGLLTRDAAKNDKQVTDYFFKTFADRGDGILDETLNLMGLDPETAKEIKSADGVFKRYQKAVEKVRDLTEKKFQSNSGTEKAALENQIRALNADIANTKNEIQAKVEAAKSEKDNYYQPLIKNKELDTFLSSYDFGFMPKETPKKVVYSVAKSLLEEKAKENGYKIDYDFNNSDWTFKHSDGREVFVNNSPLLFKDFASKVFAENGLLKVSGANTPNGSPINPRQPVIVSGPQSANQLTPEAIEMIEGAKKVFAV